MPHSETKQSQNISLILHIDTYLRAQIITNRFFCNSCVFQQRVKECFHYYLQLFRNVLPIGHTLRLFGGSQCDNDHTVQI